VLKAGQMGEEDSRALLRMATALAGSEATDHPIENEHYVVPEPS
jgi:hypothetical protein